MAETSNSLPRALTAASIAVCSIIGAYGALYTGVESGLFDGITNFLRIADPPYIPGGPEPLKTRYTGIAPVDHHLLALVSYFAAFIDGTQGWDVTLVLWYLLAQLCAVWPLFALEGFRKGNKGRAVSWTGTMGFIFQNATFTITAPLYLIIHLFTSPTAVPSTADLTTFSVDKEDLELVPLCTVLGLVIPTIAMVLPSPTILSASVHYGWIAFWQPFPVWQSILHWALKPVLSVIRPSPSRQPSSSNNASASPASVYRFIMFFAVASQVSLLAVALTPASSVPAAWADVFAAVDLRAAFLPTPFWAPLVRDTSANPVVPADALPPLCLHLLRWDVYGGGTAILVWALYLYRVGHPQRGWAGTLGKTLVWVVLGGPVAAAAALLWDRDEAARKAARGKKYE